jgi:hypothetical protein
LRKPCSTGRVCRALWWSLASPSARCVAAHTGASPPPPPSGPRAVDVACVRVWGGVWCRIVALWLCSTLVSAVAVVGRAARPHSGVRSGAAPPAFDYRRGAAGGAEPDPWSWSWCGVVVRRSGRAARAVSTVLTVVVVTARRPTARRADVLYRIASRRLWGAGAGGAVYMHLREGEASQHTASRFKLLSSKQLGLIHWLCYAFCYKYILFFWRYCYCCRARWRGRREGERASRRAAVNALRQCASVHVLMLRGKNYSTVAVAQRAPSLLPAVAVVKLLVSACRIRIALRACRVHVHIY